MTDHSHAVPDTDSTRAGLRHGPVPFFGEAGTGSCRHGDGYHERHTGAADQDLLICLDNPIGDHCQGCLHTDGELTLWTHCPHLRRAPHAPDSHGDRS
ncbi:hypothetical protein ACIQWR_39020 [Streptomyces sp. NPDC098789]|uniref:hypothetical protein n=1 Tax=Streptomyces sp. NPDC098789 TaxID=3366098 RepID=UPI00382ABFE9